jgi:hypothetical protein
MQCKPVMLGKSDELRDRVEAKKHKLLSKYNELKADTRKEAGEARTKLKARLDEIEDTIKSGWNNMSDAAKAKLNKWLDED